MTASRLANIAIDFTGYGLHHASQLYEKRIGRRKRYINISFQ